MKPAVSVIMPAYNEGRCIHENIRTTREVLAEAGIEAEIIAVDDGSVDDTRDEIDRAARDFTGVVSACNPCNMGKGMALRTGFERSSGEIVVFLDADLDLHPSQIRHLIEALDDDGGPWDIVTTSKHHPDSKLDYPFWRTVASWAYFLFIKALFGLPVRDTQTGLKVFRRKVLDDVFHRLLVKKFAYDVELLAAAVRYGHRVREFPVVLDFKRELKWGRIRIPDVLSLFIDTLAIFYRLRLIRYYDSPKPLRPAEGKRVLIVTEGCPPPPEVVERLAFEGAENIACVTGERNLGDSDGPVVFIPDAGALAGIAGRAEDGFEYVGFLGPGHLPLGSWVRGAVRDFSDPRIDAVTGPAIPSAEGGWREKAAGMVFSSSLAAGTDSFLYSYQTARRTRKAHAGNLFVRTSVLAASSTCGGLDVRGGFAYLRKPVSGTILYDPDMAVSIRIPPLFIPYLRDAWRRAFDAGRRVFDRGSPDHPLHGAAPLVLALILAAGWTVLPAWIYHTLAILYAAGALIAGFSYFSLRLAFPVAAGIVCEHAVRAVAFPAGVAAGMMKREKTFAHR